MSPSRTALSRGQSRPVGAYAGQFVIEDAVGFDTGSHQGVMLEVEALVIGGDMG
jgi:hypothetical protein